MESYRILVLGDFHYGESYMGGGAQVLKEHGYSYSTARLRPFIEASDSFILNLETPLVDPNVVPSPFQGQKSYVHWGDPYETANALKDLRVDAVSLANNHTVDHGPEGLESTFKTLTDADIAWFGAGRNIDEARAPHRVALPERVGGGEVHFHGSFQYSTRNDVDFGIYAEEATPGCAPLSRGHVPNARAETTREDAFQVAFPHWGANYKWRGPRQYRLAHRFLAKDYDLVLGHGGHNLQEVHRKQQRWIVYGIGNGNFNSDGRWEQFEEENGILPVSFWAVLEVHLEDQQRWMELKLYPVYSDNRKTGHQPGPVSTEDFARVVEGLSNRAERPWRFDNPARNTGEDGLGHFISLELGEWALGRKPARLVPAIEGGDPGDWPLRSPDTALEDQIFGSGKPFSASMMAMPALTEGATVRWLGGLAVIESQDKRVLAFDYRAHESSLGASIVKDKALTAELLGKHDVPTPETVLVESADEAIHAARSIPGAAVVKPRDGRKSQGVSTGLVRDDEVREAFNFARSYGSEIIVQQHIEVDEELRVMASPERAIAVIRRILPHVTGDGVSSIDQLVADKNLQRELNPALRNRPIPIDGLTHKQLQRNGFDLETVPDLGRTVTVRGVAGLSVGADAFQALEETEPMIKQAASAAIASIPGLGWGGVDLVIEKDSGRPYVIEINSQAAYGAAMFPTFGEPRDVASEAWALRYSATAPEPNAVPHVAEPKPTPQTVVGPELSTSPTDQVDFAQIFESSLRRQGYTVAERNHQILQVFASKGRGTWTTRAGRTAADRFVVQRVMQQHEWVTSLLDAADVPRPRTQVVSSVRQLRRFVEGRVSTVTLTPITGPWEGRDFLILTDTQAMELDSLPETVRVQARSRGRHLRVLASREEAAVVIAKNTSGPLNDAHLAAAGKQAVEAVRAIPELHWAAVDLVVRPSRLRENRSGGVLVEGLTLTPSFSSTDRIIAGDLDGFCRSIIDAAMAA